MHMGDTSIRARRPKSPPQLRASMVLPDVNRSTQARDCILHHMKILKISFMTPSFESSSSIQQMYCGRGAAIAIFSDISGS